MYIIAQVEEICKEPKSSLLLQDVMHISLHAQLCLTVCDPMDGGLPGSSVHEIS